MNILCTGGSGYIGSHTCVVLQNAGYDVTVLDNLSNSKSRSLELVKEITGKPVRFYETDLLDTTGMQKIFTENRIDAVIHFAGLKAVGESTEIPLEYYRNNINGTVNLCGVMKDNNVKNLVFSSSCTVYGEPASVPITEDFPVVSAANPYGRSKLMIEEILKDLYASDPSWNIILLRYFNPVGAHKSGKIGEDPNGIPNNLLPYISQVAVGKLKELSVYGDDYSTPDGTGVRDYIHVMDLAEGHVKAVEKLKEKPGLLTYNLGTGNGFSVLEMIRAFEETSGKKVPYKIVERRSGDIAEAYADCRKAEKELRWKAKRGLKEICEDSWRWQSNNPDGY